MLTLAFFRSPSLDLFFFLSTLRPPSPFILSPLSCSGAGGGAGRCFSLYPPRCISLTCHSLLIPSAFMYPQTFHLLHHPIPFFLFFYVFFFHVALPPSLSL